MSNLFQHSLDYYTVNTSEDNIQGAGGVSQLKLKNIGTAQFLVDVTDKNGNAISGTINAAAFLVTVQLGKNGAGALTLTGAAVGDKVIGVANLTTPGDLKASFETTITVVNQIQQSSATDLSAKQIQFMLLKQ